jgi:transaldolase
MPEGTLEAFETGGVVARTADGDLAGAQATIEALADLGIALDDVTQQLEDEGVAAFVASFDDLLATLTAKATQLSGSD